MHIPKTAGTSQHQSFNRMYGKDNVFWFGNDCPGNIKHYPEKLVGASALVGGHKPLSFYPAHYWPLFCTVLRDPVMRAISLFTYFTKPELARLQPERKARERQLQNMLRQGVDPDSMLNSLTRCESFRKLVSNVQCAYLSRSGASFESVLSSLMRHDFVVGTLDNYDDFHQALGQILGWPATKPGLINRSRDNYAEDYLADTDLISMLQALNTQDIKLLDYVAGEHNGLLVNIKNRQERDRRLARLPLRPGSDDNRPHPWATIAQNASFRERHNKLPWPLSDIKVCELHRIFYPIIPGAARSKALNRLLDQSIMEHDNEASGSENQNALEDLNAAHMLRHKPLSTAREITTDDSYFQFALLDDPIHRLVEVYTQSFLASDSSTASRPKLRRCVAAIQGLANPDFNLGVTFRQFVERIVQLKPREQDLYCLPQHFFLKGVKNKYRLYRQDQLQKLQRDLLSCAGLSVNFSDPVISTPPLNRGSACGKSWPGQYADCLPRELPPERPLQASELINDELRDIISQFYKEDLDLYASAGEDYEVNVS
ncbi:MAG: hypothetical protein HOC23_18610 [Halieaceae bacterium]|nr:hypothetical protein [Halieaceae bacterium]